MSALSDEVRIGDEVYAAPLVMGIVNVTPDSFSDGGEWLVPERAIEHGAELARGGALILDVGGESTRPGAEPVEAGEELRRIEPVVAGLVARVAEPHVVSIDTAKATVAAAALDHGAQIVNDVTALRGDPEMAALCAERDCEVILMHMQGEPRTMQDDPRYGDIVEDVRVFLAERIEAAVAAGIDSNRIWVDPGVGFGKALRHNLELLGRLGELRELGCPIVIGTSRKRFIGEITGAEVGDRLPGTIASNLMAYVNGASVFRVHDALEAHQALTVASLIESQAEPGDGGSSAKLFIDDEYRPE